MIYSETIKIHFDKADSAGVLYFANLLKICHQGLENYISSTDMGWDYWFNNPDFAAPIVDAQCKFKKPMKAGQDFNLEISIEEKGQHHISFTYDVSKNDTLYAHAKTIHVFIDKSDGKKISIPKGIIF